MIQLEARRKNPGETPNRWCMPKKVLSDDRSEFGIRVWTLSGVALLLRILLRQLARKSRRG